MGVASSLLWWIGDERLTRLAGDVRGGLQNVELKPFTTKEAQKVLKLHKVDESWHNMIMSVAGTVPSMLRLFRRVTAEKDFLISKETMKGISEDIVDDMQMQVTGRCTDSIKDNYSGPQQQWSLKVRLQFGSDLWKSMAFVRYISTIAGGDSSTHKTSPI